MPFARAPVVLLAAFAALASAGRALASERVSLQWNAPEGCPPGAAVVAEVDRLLGGAAARPAEPLAVTATVRREGGGAYRVRLETPGASGPRVREIEAASCKTLGDTTALIVAMMIDPAAVSASSPPPAREAAQLADASPGPAGDSASGAGASPRPAGDSPSGADAFPRPAGDSASGAGASPRPAGDSPRLAGDPPRLAGDSPGPAGVSPPLAHDSSRVAGDSPGLAPDASRGASSSPPPARASSRRPPLAIALRALVARGSLPNTSFGVGAVGAVYFGALRLEAGAAIYLPERSTPYPVLPTTGGEFDLALGTAAACWEVRIKRHIYVAPCFDVEIGSLDGKSFGVTTPGEGASLWAAAGGGGRLTARPWRSVALTFGLDAVFPIQRSSFTVTGLGSIYQPSWAAARLSLGLELRL